MLHTTKNFELSVIGVLYLQIRDEEGEWVRNEHLGCVEEAEVSRELQDEYEEHLDMWKDVSRKNYLEV